ncbi:TonB-dependent receptor [Colwellia sp. D2M02]|uniref:TonB-dependent receptor n=1 Tax=Colwellia sp. D2M02 TaxID=2841562 RepID=UPI001C0923A4|nr:TonB-dependent receptor [Colwellia sp. D2M02]MBU2892482.1 TonB-dependent receptor [Colwellia sp. D2M02]
MNKTITTKKTRLAISVQQLFSAKNIRNNLSIACLGLALPISAFAEEPNKASDKSEDIEVIQVTGMLGSMKAASLLKRTDGRIVDAIVAEDIGKLPDNNIAEALQRITGVSINSDFGVGDSVSIRGLPQNRVELNGRSTIGDSRDGVSLQDFPSSFLKAVEVVKSPTADMIEGALGGTVSLKTVRPLELKKLTAAMSLDGEYADKTENVAPIFSGSIGDNWDLGSAGNFGALVMLSYQDRELRQDQFSSKARPVDTDINGAEGNTPSGNIILRDEHSVEQYVESRERTALNLSLQWAPESGNGMVYLDLNGTKRSGEQEGSSILGVVGALQTNENTTQDANGVNNYTLTNEFGIPKTYSDFRETESFSNALGAEWNITDNIMISGEIAVASSESIRPDAEFTLRPIEKQTFLDSGGVDLVNHVYDGAFSQSGNRLPSIIHSESDAFTSDQNLALRTFKAEDKRTYNDETAVRFDVTIDEPLGLGWLSKVKAGVRATKRDYEYEQYKEEVKDIYKNAKNSDGSLATIWIDDYNAAFPNSFSVVSHDNSFDQIGHSGQNDLLTYMLYNGLSNLENSYGQLQQLLAGTSLATTGSLADNQEFQESAYRNVAEDTAAVYLSAYLDFDDISAIVGGRYVKTNLDSTVYLNGEKVTGDNDYSDFLPSLNVTYNYSDETLFRFAAAKVMRRANFGELSPAFDINNDITGATQGSIDLDPYRATQFDISIEHYFGEGNALSFAVFYKDVESFLSNETSCIADSSTVTGQNVTQWNNVCQLNTAGVSQSDMVYSDSTQFTDAEGLEHVAALRDAGKTGIATTKDTNGENGKVQGFEIGYQQFFTFLPGAFSGLGLSANYTYADSEQPNGSPLLQISKNTYNLQAFWEYKDVALRLAYNYRDSFLDTENEKRVENINYLGTIKTDDGTVYGNNYRDDRGQLDFSASWNINEHFTLVGNATNLTGEASIYTSELDGAWKYTEADRRLTLGVRAKF